MARCNFMGIVYIGLNAENSFRNFADGLNALNGDIMPIRDAIDWHEHLMGGNGNKMEVHHLKKVLCWLRLFDKDGYYYFEWTAQKEDENHEQI